MNVCWHHCNPNLICSICQHNKPHKARPWKAITEAASNNRTKDEFRSEARQNIWHTNGLVALSLPEQNALGHCTSASEPEIRFRPKKWTASSSKMPRAMKITNLSSFRFRKRQTEKKKLHKALCKSETAKYNNKTGEMVPPSGRIRKRKFSSSSRGSQPWTVAAPTTTTRSRVTNKFNECGGF